MAPPHTPVWRRITTVAAAVVLLVAACSTGSAAPPPDALDALGRTPTGALGEISVDIDYPTLDGAVANLTDLGGTPIVLNFFAAWCPSCVSEMPGFEQVHQRRGDDVAFIGMSEDLVTDDALELVARTGITYRTGWDPTGRVLNAFRAYVMPTTVFITADGDVAHTFSGALEPDELDELIVEHLL